MYIVPKGRLIVQLPFEKCGYMAEFYLYTDESGKLGQSPMTSFCGYVAGRDPANPRSEPLLRRVKCER